METNYSKSFSLGLFVLICAMATVTTSSFHALECIDACWDITHFLTGPKCVQCYKDPPIVDIMCLVSCGHKDKNFVFQAICRKCEENPPFTQHMCETACNLDNQPELAGLCDKCTESEFDYTKLHSKMIGE